MQFIVHKCPHCREYLKIPAGRSSVLCFHCGLLVTVPSPELPLAASSFGRIVRYTLFGLLFVAALSLLILSKFLGWGLDCLLYLLRHRIGWLFRQRSARLSRHRAVSPRLVLTKSANHRMITKIAQSKET